VDSRLHTFTFGGWIAQCTGFFYQPALWVLPLCVCVCVCVCVCLCEWVTEREGGEGQKGACARVRDCRAKLLGVLHIIPDWHWDR
jgi:hypothetical protein